MTYHDLPKRYRIEDPYHDDGTPEMVIYYVVRKTAVGAWVAPGWAAQRMLLMGVHDKVDPYTRKELVNEGARFVLDGDGKRYAHESEDWARFSYKRRKLSQIGHAKRAIERAENGLHWLRTGKSTKDEVASMGVPYFPPFEATGMNGLI